MVRIPLDTFPDRWRHARHAFGAAVTCLALTGCDWVDSAGDGETAGPIRQAAPITLDEQPLNGAIGVPEDRIVRLEARRNGDPRRDVRFESTPLLSGALDSCAAIEGFAIERAVDTLEAACSIDADDCSVAVERLEEAGADEPVALELTIPPLRAPVGLRYQVALGRQAADAEGQGGFIEEDTRQIDLCLVPINEAPQALNDTYVVLENRTLDIDAAQGVLANDVDDDDTGNEPLVATLSIAPQRSASFSLRPDGGFLYAPAPTDGRADVLDTFTYRAGDGGAQSAPATVTVRIVTANQAPQAVGELPALEGRVGDLLSIDFADFFVDPESNPLDFSFDEPLPADGSLSLGSNGLLVGVPGADDAGTYPLTLLISDGSAQLAVPVALVIEAAVAALDEAPVHLAATVFDQIVELGNPIVPVRARFEDPEGEPLSYRMAGAVALTAGLRLNPNTGVVSGRPRQRQRLEGLMVEASDPAGNATRSVPFSIIVR